MNAAGLAARHGQLVEFAAQMASDQEGDPAGLHVRLLGLQAQSLGPGGGHSELNADGSPVQLCVTTSKSGSKWRLLGDPGWFLGDPADRLAVSTSAAEALFARAGADELLTAVGALYHRALPPAADDMPLYNRGFLWLAGSLSGAGVALYLEMQPLGVEEGWAAAGRWLDDILPHPHEARRMIAALAGEARLVSAGVEGAGLGDGRAKLYWRLDRPQPLSGLGVELLDDDIFAAFLRRAVGPREMRLSGTVISTSFSLETGALVDAKIDLCAHCLPQPVGDWIDLIDDLARACGADPPPVAEALRTQVCEVANIGFGVDVSGRRRTNLYLKPKGLEPATSAEGIRERLRLAAGYLIGIQQPDGGWSDYRLPVGSATHWVTGLVGASLAQADAACGLPEARDAAVRAAAYLQRTRPYDAGWGYNETTGVDADTTGYALRLIQAVGLQPEPRDIDRLLEHWRPRGGFATYQTPGHWADVHPCVTAAAFEALPPHLQARLRPSLLTYLERTIQPDRTWPAYWWRNHLYSTWNHLRLMRRLGLGDEFPPPARPVGFSGAASPFELAYAAGIEFFRGDETAGWKRLGQLFDQQRVDGGWAGGFNLRVTDPDCAQPWETPKGLLYIDHLGAITTASATFVLSELLDA